MCFECCVYLQDLHSSTGSTRLSFVPQCLLWKIWVLISVYLYGFVHSKPHMSPPVEDNGIAWWSKESWHQIHSCTSIHTLWGVELNIVGNPSSSPKVTHHTLRCVWSMGNRVISLLLHNKIDCKQSYGCFHSKAAENGLYSHETRWESTIWMIILSWIWKDLKSTH